MPLTGTGAILGQLILTKQKAAVTTFMAGKTPPLTAAQVLLLRQKIAEAEGEANIEHIVANGLGAVSVLSVSGVTTGPGVSGPGSGNLI